MTIKNVMFLIWLSICFIAGFLFGFKILLIMVPLAAIYGYIEIKT